jgi:hypothetical protein
MTKHRDGLMAGGALVVVLVVLALGFHRLGPRANQRAIRADERRIEALQSVALQMYFRNRRQMPMPATLAELPQRDRVNLNDPVTNAPYEYHPKSATAYELCATFAADSGAPDEPRLHGHSGFWSHPKGRYCYQLDAAQTTEY